MIKGKFFTLIFPSCFFQAIAIVFGFLVSIGLIIMMAFAIKSRSQINRYGMHRVLWEEPRSIKDGFPHGVEKWVSRTQWVCCTFAPSHLISVPIQD